MATCPACGNEILAQSIDAGKCLACGRALPSGLSAQDVEDPAATVDSIAPLPNLSATVDPTTATIDPTSGGVAPSLPPVDSSRLGDSSQTIDLPAASHVGRGLADSAQTIDLPTGSTELERIGDSSQTIDLPGDGGSSWEKPRIGDTSRTIDLHSGNADPRIGDSSQTIDLPTDSTAALHAANRTKRVRPSDKTLVGAASSDAHDFNEENLASAWQGTLAGNKPQQTLRVDATITTSGRSSIVVKPRNLVKADATAVPSPGADYELLNVIGEGGMGVVYSARQASVDRLVALKMLKGERKLSEDQRDKFISEAVVTGDLDHPNIVPIYDLGANEEGALFYSMKQVHGTPWMKVIRTLSLEENLEILMKVADAVGFAHEAGVIHRDLKPENVMLGKHGEVLVMDWGLALATESFRAFGSITQTGSMGGTPAYMSPEMATGPVDRVTFLSDIYLLGGILYEIVTGQLPHTGSTVLECLKSAAKNRIQPTSKSGELLDIALKAMATNPADRHQSVESFQKAIREYRSHSESIRLAEDAEAELAIARESNEYRVYADAMYGFENAIKLWPGNAKARRMWSESKIAYAESATRREDFDLGLSILDADDPDHAELREQIENARRERNARQGRIRMLRYVSAALVGVLLLTISAAFFLVKGQRDLAQTEKERADVERDRAFEAEAEAKNERDQAETARAQAVAATEVATRERQRAETEKTRAETEKDRADIERDKAIEAKLAEQYETYVAQIGLAAARIQENSFDSAVEILNHTDREFRHWEWGRLAFLCQQSVEDFQADGPMDAVAFDPAGQRLATGSWDGKARIWDAHSGELRATVSHGQYVHAVAFTPSGAELAIGGSDPVVKLVGASDGQTLREFPGHEASVLSVVFSRDGQRMLTTSYDKTARVWDVASGRLLQTLQGHNWWVWSAAFSPDGRRIVTASQDGKAIVWQQTSAAADAPYARKTEFTSHAGPVYSVVFSPDGALVASAGFGKRVLLWNPDDIAPVDLRKRVDRIAEAPQKFRALEGHTGAVRAVRFSHNGKLLVSGAQDNTVRVWDVASGALIKALRGHGGQVRACVFSPDDKTVASASHDQRAKLWNLDGYQEARVLRGRVLAGHVDAVLDARFSPDGAQIITASRDRSARAWDVKTGQARQALTEGHEFLATAARFSPDGQTLITSGGDNTVRVWDVSAGTQYARFDRTGRSSAVAVSADGALVLTGSDDRTAKLWSLTSGRMLQQLTPGTAANPVPMESRADVTAVAFAADNRTLVVGDANGRAWLWKLDSADDTWKEAAFLQGHGATITAAAFTPGGERVLTASGDKTVGQWDVATGRERRELALHLDDWVSSLAVSSDGVTAVTASSDGVVRVWDLVRAAPLRRLEVGSVPTSHVDIAPGGKIAATVSAVDRTLRLWDLASGQEIFAPGAAGSQPFLGGERLGGLIWSASFSPSGDYLATVGGNDAQLWDTRTGRANMSFSPHGAVASAAFSPDGKRVVTGSWDNSAKIWDVATGRSELKLFGAHTGFVNTAVFSPDGAQVLTASDDGTARLWNATTGQASNIVFAGHQGRVRSAVFSPDGLRVLTASNDKTARIWDARSAREIRSLVGHDWAVRCAVFSRDGAWALTGSEDNTARLWDAATGQTKFTLLGHSAPVTAVAISPDGLRALTGSQDNTIKLWDATTGKEVLTLTGHQQEVTAVGFSPDANRHEVLSASRDGTAIIWLAVDWQGAAQGAPTSAPRAPLEAEEPFVPPLEFEPAPQPNEPAPKLPLEPEKAPPPALPKEFDNTTPSPPTTTSPTEQPTAPKSPVEEDPLDDLPDLFPSDSPPKQPETKQPPAKPMVEPTDKPADATPTAPAEKAPAPREEPLPELPFDLFPPNEAEKKSAENEPAQPKPIQRATAKPEPALPPNGNQPAAPEPNSAEPNSAEPALPSLDLFPEAKQSEAKQPGEKQPTAPTEKAPAPREEPLPELPFDLFPPNEAEKKSAENPAARPASDSKPADVSPAESRPAPGSVPSKERLPAPLPTTEDLPALPNLFPDEAEPARPAEKKPAAKPGAKPSAQPAQDLPPPKLFTD